MNKNSLLGLCALVLAVIAIFGYTFTTHTPPSRYNSLIFVEPTDQTGIVAVQNSIKPAIDKIISEELKLSGKGEFTNENYPLFVIKRRPRITLYYFNGLAKNQEQFVENAITAEAAHLHLPQKTSVTAQANFFGSKHDELVLLIADPAQELAALNTTIKRAANKADIACQQATKENLFDVASSEAFPYLPHITLGRINSVAAKTYVDQAQAMQVWERIKQRILNEVVPLIAGELKKKAIPLTFDKAVFIILADQPREVSYQLKS